jgi:dihydrofolate synthase/folylpolyglutamate synthase
MLSSVLSASGLRVGTYLSPHIEEVNERIRIDGEPLSDPVLTEAIEAIDRARWDYLKTMGCEGQGLTYFEFLTVVAFHVFAEQKVDIAIVEVGLGGRLDATNVVDPLVSVITSVGMDHMDKLGTSLAEIASEKAGIIKRGVPVVVGSLPEPALKQVQAVAAAREAPLWRFGAHLRREKRQTGWNLMTPEGGIADVSLGMLGEHQGSNALVAVGVLFRLKQLGFPLGEDALRTGLTNARLGGRIERLLPNLVVDGAHNEDSVRALEKWLASQPRNGTRILLWGMGEGRDAAGIIQPLLAHVDEVVTTRCAHPRARDPMELALSLQDLDCVLSAGASIEETLPEVMAEADEVLVAGSLFVAGAARALVREGGLDGPPLNGSDPS